MPKMAHLNFRPGALVQAPHNLIRNSAQLLIVQRCICAAQTNGNTWNLVHAEMSIRSGFSDLFRQLLKCRMVSYGRQLSNLPGRHFAGAKVHQPAPPSTGGKARVNRQSRSPLRFRCGCNHGDAGSRAPAGTGRNIPATLVKRQHHELERRIRGRGRVHVQADIRAVRVITHVHARRFCLHDSPARSCRG